MPANEKRIENLQAKKAQIEAELARLRARSRTENRKALTRKKILLGAIVMQEMEARPEIDDWIRKLLHERLTKNRDRELFGLKALAERPHSTQSR